MVTQPNLSKTPKPAIQEHVVTMNKPAVILAVVLHQKPHVAVVARVVAQVDTLALLQMESVSLMSN